MAKLYFRYGAMGSSKTANAIMVQYNYRERGQNALMLKPRLDNRDGENIVGSRSGLSAKCLFVEEIDSVDLSLYNCIIVDEAQFLTKQQVEKLVSIVDELNIPVICYGLRADFRGELFEGSTWLMAWADTIEEIKTVCWCGRKATWNARIYNGKVVKDGAQIMLGGNESYVALCRKHWAKGELAPEEIRKITTGQKNYLELFAEENLLERRNSELPENSELYVFLLNGHTVSAILLHDAGEGSCEILGIATERESRCKGYAGRLIGHIARMYQVSGKKLIAKVPSEKLAFFEKNGFVCTGHADDAENCVIAEYKF